MRLATTLPATADPAANARLATDLEAAGIDVIFVAEIYSFDAMTTLGYLASITDRVQLGTGIAALYSRTPALTAMSAASLDALSGGRFILGLGASGPQVVEGWHGVPYDHPVGRTREIVDICRKVWRRERLEHDGARYRIPLPADEGTGLGKPLKLVNTPLRADIPIYLASLGPKNLQLTAELANGWLPHLFHPERSEIWQEDLDAGMAERDPALGDLVVVADVVVGFGDEARVEAAGRRRTALYVGGMGSRDRNFYNDVFRRYGYEDEAATIQDHYLAGRREDAEAAVPDDFLRATTLTGDEGRVRERLAAYEEAGVTCLDLAFTGSDPVVAVEMLRRCID